MSTRTIKRNKQRTMDALALDPQTLTQLGTAIGAAMANAQAGYARGVRPGGMFGAAYKEASITPTNVSIYGRNTIFDPCSPGDIWGLQVQTVGLMNWLGYRPNRFYSRRVEFIHWIGPQGTAGEGAEPTTGAGSPCDDPATWEYGTCGYNLLHKSWYQRGSEGLDPHTIVQDRCETTPRYRLNGTQISDDVEWQANGILTVLNQDIRRDMIHGSHANAYQMEGLEGLVKSGYTNDDGQLCPAVDSIMVDWAHDDLDGANNGFGNFFNYLDEVVTEIEHRASAIGTISEVDMALMTTRYMATCILDAYSCYTICGVTVANDVTDQALRAQTIQYRQSLNGGPLYDGTTAVGYISLKSGRRLPIIVDDMLDIERGGASSWCADIYLLTRRVGSQDVLYGEYLDLSVYEERVKRQMATFSVRVDGGGRFAYKGKEDNFCLSLSVGTSPELYLSAPWAQARFSDVCCTRHRQPITGDPFQPNYMPGGRPLHEAYNPV